MTKAQIRSLINKARDNGFSIGAIAKVAGLNPSTVHRWYAGDTKPNAASWKRLRDAARKAGAR